MVEAIAAIQVLLDRGYADFRESDVEEVGCIKARRRAEAARATIVSIRCKGR